MHYNVTDLLNLLLILSIPGVIILIAFGSVDGEWKEHEDGQDN